MKERSLCVISDLREAVFKHFHKMIVFHCIYFVCMILNATPALQGISKKFSPRHIVTGRHLDVKKDCRAPFGAYVEAIIDANVTNTVKDHTHSCLSLVPAVNLQGSLKCFDILTGKVVIRRTIKVLSIPDRFLNTLNRC